MSAAPVITLSLQSLRLLLLFTIVVSFYFNIHAIPLFDLDEGAFSEATREMLISGDFISTTLDGEPRYDKPILIYWLQALSVTLNLPSGYPRRLPPRYGLWLFICSCDGYVMSRQVWPGPSLPHRPSRYR